MTTTLDRSGVPGPRPRWRSARQLQWGVYDKQYPLSGNAFSGLVNP